MLSYRADILTFAGVEVDVKFQKDAPEAKECFRLHEDGYYRKNGNGEKMFSRQSNILKSVIIAKKSWGLHVDMWSDGIAEWCFTKEELLKQFEDFGIKIPEPFLKEFDSAIERKKLNRNMKEYNRLNNRK